MLVKKVWIQKSRFKMHEWRMEGWYLFGFIPVYVRDLEPRHRRS